MSIERQNEIFKALDSLTLIDSHSHINPHSPASSTIADVLGYHYYTELAHSSGMPREQIEEPGIEPREKVRRLFTYLDRIDNTAQWSWLEELAKELFGWTEGPIDATNWEKLYDSSYASMQSSDWEEQVLSKSRIERIFLTNDFDDPLTGFDTHRYVPCLRTDDLVFHFHLAKTRDRLQAFTSTDVKDLKSFDEAIRKLFTYFKERNARACAISLPPWFAPVSLSKNDSEAAAALERTLKATDPGAIADADRKTIAYWVFWRLAEHCREFRLPFDLMIGVNRRVYPSGVYQGQDLYDSRVSLIQYSDLLNAFPEVIFPISVLASVTNQELVDYAWIFPNVVTHGHWWYSNTPTFIEHDLRARIEAIPRNKQIGYYSDAYKLEFILPKYRMYKRILAKVLSESVCGERGKSETYAIQLGTQILRGNVESVFEIQTH